jgi:anti-anti-sigma regulatory factor
MKESSASMTWCVTPQVVCLRLAGRATFSVSGDFRRLILESVASGHRRFVLDLGQCLTMDSTFLGTLTDLQSKVAVMIAEGGPAAIELYQPSPRVQTLLDNLCVADRFPIVERVDWPTDQFLPVPLNPQAQQKTDLLRTSIEAHQTLMSVNDANVSKFKDVVSMLEDDLKRAEGTETTNEHQ